MVEANKSYIPFARVMESVAGEKPSPYGGVSNPFKRVKGDNNLYLILLKLYILILLKL